MLFKNISILSEDFELLEDMYVGIQGDRIAYIGNETPEHFCDFIKDNKIYDGKGLLLMSGFYNAHTHSPMTLLRGYGENMMLNDWLNKKIFPYEAELTIDSVYWGTMLAIAESLMSGIVSSTDMYYFSPAVAKAVLDSGVKMNISRALVNFDGANPLDMASYAEMDEFCSEYHMKGMGRLRADVSIHAEYTSDPSTCMAVAEYGKANNLNAHIHLSETKNEHEGCRARHGKTPAEYFSDLGIFDIPCTAAHCVWLEDEDFDILHEKGVTVASCPVSNMKLASGIADTAKMIDKGINLALGTDSVASNNSLNFFEEMKFMALGIKAWKSNPAILSPADVLRAATLGGAKSQGRKDCGAVSIGNKADLIAVNLDTPNMQPIHEIANNLVYSASPADIVLTMVDGRILYERGEFTTLDIEKIIANVGLENGRILGNLERGNSIG